MNIPDNITHGWDRSDPNEWAAVPKTADEEAIQASQGLSEEVKASRADDRPTKRLNDLTDGDHVVEL